MTCPLWKLDMRQILINLRLYLSDFLTLCTFACFTYISLVLLDHYFSAVTKFRAYGSKA